MKNWRSKTIKDKEKVWVNFKGLCKGCGICLEICPQKCLFWGSELGYYGNLTPECDIEKCIACGLCQINCPDCAIKIEKIKTKKGGEGVKKKGNKQK